MRPNVSHRRAAPLIALALLAILTVACDGTSTATNPEPEPEEVSKLPAPSNILLITVDTLRADHLSSYGYPRQTSPVLDALAAEGVRFDQASVQWPKTGPSFASIFTSTYPRDNGIVRRVGIDLPCQFSMLAEGLQEQGYGTYAVVSNGALGREFHFDQGFDLYVESWKVKHEGETIDPNGAEAVNRLATGVIGEIDRSRPFFLWVHYLDPHFPYRPPAAWSDRFQDDEHFDPTTRIQLMPRHRQDMVGIGRSQVLDGRDELAFYVARYDAEIAYTDHQIGLLLDTLRAEGLMERTLTAFTSDHGESLGDHHYYFDHGRFGFQTCLRVPFILHYPGVLSPRVDRQPVELLDLAPTLLEAAGMPLPDGAWMQGESLTPRLLGSAPPETPSLAFAEAGYATDGRWQHIVRDQRFKLIYARAIQARRWIGGEDVHFALYDLDADPEESAQVADDHPEDFERLKRALWEHEQTPPFTVRTDDEVCSEDDSMDPETEELLRSLGYL